MIENLEKTCSFIGHRNIIITKALEEKVRKVVCDLITIYNVSIFLFGSKSDFNFLCHKIVTELKFEYPKIKRVAYTCQSETCIFEDERIYWENICTNIQKQEVHFLGFEEEVEHKTKYTAGRASYVERNQAMIKSSDYCVFYFNEKYKPEKRCYAKNCNFFYQPKSGTLLAYNYAKMMKKTIINLFDLNE